MRSYVGKIKTDIVIFVYQWCLLTDSILKKDGNYYLQVLLEETH